MEPGRNFRYNPVRIGSFLVRPQDATQPWKAEALHHEPTVHRMQWVKAADGSYSLSCRRCTEKRNKNGERQV